MSGLLLLAVGKKGKGLKVAMNKEANEVDYM